MTGLCFLNKKGKSNLLELSKRTCTRCDWIICYL